MQQPPKRREPAWIVAKLLLLASLPSYGLPSCTQLKTPDRYLLFSGREAGTYLTAGKLLSNPLSARFDPLNLVGNLKSDRSTGDIHFVQDESAELVFTIDGPQPLDKFRSLARLYPSGSLTRGFSVVTYISRDDPDRRYYGLHARSAAFFVVRGSSGAGVGALLGILVSLISLFAALVVVRRWFRVRRFRKRMIRLKRLGSRGKLDPSIVKQRLSDLLKQIGQAYAKGKISKDDNDALNELARI